MTAANATASEEWTSVLTFICLFLFEDGVDAGLCGVAEGEYRDGWGKGGGEGGRGEALSCSGGRMVYGASKQVSLRQRRGT